MGKDIVGSYKKRDWQEFCTAFCMLNRAAELERLIQWATRKQLQVPKRLYQRHLLDTEIRLQRIQFRSPHVFFWARVIQWFAQHFNPPPKHWKKGSAAGYRYYNFV